MRPTKVLMLLSLIAMASLSVVTAKANAGDKSPPALIMQHTVHVDFKSPDFKLQEMPSMVAIVSTGSMIDVSEKIACNVSPSADEGGIRSERLGHWKVNRCRLCK